MPPVPEQMARPGSRPNPELVAARFLLKPGRGFEEAVQKFQPYDKIREEYPEARAAAKALIAEGRQEGKAAKKRRTFVYINNRLEGNSLATIQALTEPPAEPVP